MAQFMMPILDPKKCANPCCSGALVDKQELSWPKGSENVQYEVHPRLKKCSRCKQAAYCSVACQREHWRNGHRDDCKPQTEPKSKPGEESDDDEGEEKTEGQSLSAA